MSEPRNMEEAIVAYETNQFSRKKLVRFMVDRILATETALEALRGQMADLVGALVRERVNPPVERMRQLYEESASVQMIVDPTAVVDPDAPASSPKTHSERVKEGLARKRAQAIADGVGEAANG